MFTETVHRFRAAAPLLTQTMLLTELRIGSTHGSRTSGHLGRRHLAVSAGLCAKVPPRRKPRVQVEIPGLERITYADRMHYVPGLAKPTFPTWVRDWHDPSHYYSPKPEEMPLNKQKPCFIFHQRTNPLEGVRQALWLTKSKLTNGLPPQVMSLAQDVTNQIENQDERVQNAIKHARFWDTTEARPARNRFCLALLRNLLHLCRGLQTSHPALGSRMLAEKSRLSATWSRGEDLFQVRGQSGLLMTSMTALPVLSGKAEVQSTEDHVLETFYPVSPTIDLTTTNLYQEENHTGFREDYPYPHAHTLFLLEEDNSSCKLLPEQLRAKMIMFSFANALARARRLHGVLTQPIVVQAVATNGRMFQYVVFQLNTLDLQPDQGVKNQVWADQDRLLYDYAMVRDIVRKRTVQVPAGLSGYQPETFHKFLALYLHGAV